MPLNVVLLAFSKTPLFGFVLIRIGSGFHPFIVFLYTPPVSSFSNCFISTDLSDMIDQSRLHFPAFRASDLSGTADYLHANSTLLAHW